MRFLFNQTANKKSRKQNKVMPKAQQTKQTHVFSNECVRVCVCDLVHPMILDILRRIQSHLYRYLAAFLVEMLSILPYKHHTVCISRWVVLLTFGSSTLRFAPLLLASIRLLHYLIISAHFSFIISLFASSCSHFLALISQSIDNIV